MARILYDNMDKNALIARIAELEAKKAPNVSFKVSTKGAVSVYGLGRFPVTLYAGQWERLFSHADALKAFIAANAATVARKDD
jgi:hypothetical protein